MMKPASSLSRLALVASLIAVPAAAQTYKASAIAANASTVVPSNSPVSAYHSGGVGTAIGTATCSAGAFYSTGWANHSSAVFVLSAGGTNQFDAFDVVFSSPNSDPIDVQLNLQVSGAFDYVLGVDMTVQFGIVAENGHFQHHPASGTVSTGLLSGYDGVGPFSIKSGVFQVPVNTPVPMQILFQARTTFSTGPRIASHRQKLTFDGTSGGLFDVPAGITVNSVEAGIVNNTWGPSTELHLAANPSTVTAGNTVQMTSFNGEVGQPVLLILTSVNGTQYFLDTGIWGAFDVDGHYLAVPITTDPSWAGINLGLTAVTLSTTTGLKFSDEALITIQ